MPQVQPVQQVPLETQDLLDLQEVLDQLVHRALRGLQGLQEPLECKALLVRQDLREILDRQVLPVQQALQVQFLDLPVQRDQQVLQEQLVLEQMRFQSHYSLAVCKIGV